ncbi:TPA: hypothetical protein DDW35_09310 [Candidatus Sumerlaeota bacterium]|nr:hypothetical protein [Candidatus Sumerlaeota bacterium]
MDIGAICPRNKVGEPPPAHSIKLRNYMQASIISERFYGKSCIDSAIENLKNLYNYSHIYIHAM